MDVIKDNQGNLVPVNPDWKQEEMVEEKVGAFDYYHKKDAGINQKIADKVHAVLQEKAQVRQAQCWAYGCDRSARTWVHEVQFDFRGDKDDNTFTVISSRDYDGPVPGFCYGHMATGPSQLAEAVYKNRTEMALGIRPRRWFVVFTDGSKQGGLCQELNPLTPIINDTHTKGIDT